MNVVNPIRHWLIVVAILLAATAAGAEVVEYTLDNLILDDGGAQMFGTFTWTYEVGDFENGAGQFTFLDIPYTYHDHTDLIANFDVGHSIEIVLEGSVHDDGVDITLFLTQPLTPTTGSAIDLAVSRYEIGGNGFHDGMFLSGSVVVSGATGVSDGSSSPAAPAASFALNAHPNPFNPTTTLSYELPRGATVRIEIHDASGRIVRTLVADERHEAGHFEIRWRGRDDGGRSVPSGVYLAILRADDHVSMRKVSLLK